jgi:hypothetical protein
MINCISVYKICVLCTYWCCKNIRYAINHVIQYVPKFINGIVDLARCTIGLRLFEQKKTLKYCIYHFQPSCVADYVLHVRNYQKSILNTICFSWNTIGQNGCQYIQNVLLISGPKDYFIKSALEKRKSKKGFLGTRIFFGNNSFFGVLFSEIFIQTWNQPKIW